MSYMNELVLSLKKETILIFDLLSNMIFNIRSINRLLANMDSIFLKTNVNHIFSKISLIINPISSLSQLLMMI